MAGKFEYLQAEKNCPEKLNIHGKINWRENHWRLKKKKASDFWRENSNKYLQAEKKSDFFFLFSKT